MRPSQNRYSKRYAHEGEDAMGLTEGVAIDSAIQSLDRAYTQVQQTFPHKQLVIGETGWPSAGTPYGAAVPSAANQARYLRAFLDWAHAKG